MLSALIARSVSSLRKLENWKLISSVTMVTHFMRRFFSFEAILFWLFIIYVEKHFSYMFLVVFQY